MSGVSMLPGAGITTAEVAARYGVKGGAAAAWLAQQGIAVPTAPNRVSHWSEGGGGRCLRLGNTEFLVEHDAGAVSVPAHTANDGAWLLLRSDHCLLLDGSLLAALAQLCSFDFQRLRAEPDLVVMTLLAGISVTLVREPQPADDPRIALRLWCDASYATYLQHCLQQLAHSDHSPGEPR